MVHLKPKSEEEEIQAIHHHGFRFQHLLLFILGSAIAHALIFLLLARYEASKPVEEQEENKPIEFVVVPPKENQEPPPETNNKATENSVAEPNAQPEETAYNEKIVEEPATIPPTSAPTPAPKVAAPAPAPTPAPEVAAPTPAPAPAPTPAPEAQPSTKDLISGSDAPVSSPEPEKREETAAQDNIATRLPPKSEPSSPSGGNAADLLGGDYQKTLANSGNAFFSPEALSHKSVLSPQQISALKDPKLASYAKELQRLINENWEQNWKPEFYRDSVVVFVFDIQKNGQITELKIAKSSGSEEIDRYSLETISKIAPLPPLPPEFPLESWKITYTLETRLIE